jgi:glycosyltransferase involved in cell wall biosynthesis
MIVKNESKIIARCLDNANFALDYVSICDVGSTDNTVSLIEGWFRRNRIQGKVHVIPWTNFCDARSQSFRLAKQTFPDANYMLTLDADEVLVDNGLEKSILTLDRYHACHTDYSTYLKTRLLKASVDYFFTGYQHGYWTSNVDQTVDNNHTLWSSDRLVAVPSLMELVLRSLPPLNERNSRMLQKLGIKDKRAALSNPN